MTSRCQLCPGINPVVPPCGPKKCDLMFISEAPGQTESAEGIPFIGKSGQELDNQYLPLAGLHRSEIFISNTVSCLPLGTGKLDPNLPKDQALIQCCAQHHLYREIAECQPKVIVTMGGVANSLVPGVDLDVHWGFPYLWQVPEVGEFTIFPTFHPALGLHSPKEILRLRTCFIRLKRYLAGKLKIPQDQYPEPDYTVLNTVDELDRYIGLYSCFTTRGLGDDMAIDTEIAKEGAPYCLTFSIIPGTARLILATNRQVLDRFNWWVQQWRGFFLLHNRPFDRPILIRMGIHLPVAHIIDTMQEAWHLGNLQQGLKTLAYRLLGVEMKSFDDLVTPHSRAKCLSYLFDGLSVDWPKPASSTVQDKEGKWKEYKPHSMSTNLKIFFTHLSKNPQLDVIGRWKNWEGQHELIESKLGPYPGKCISHCPLEQIVGYACQDAARTLELWPFIKRASTRVRRMPESVWFD